MRFIFLFSLVVAVISTMDIVVPAYFRSPALWASMTNSCSQVSITAILNPGSGPGTVGDIGDFRTNVNQLRAAGGKVVGYLSSLRNQRSMALVKADVDTYIERYSLDGFFVDDMGYDGSLGSIQYYQELYSYIKTRNNRFIVIMNPGADFPEKYVTQQTGDRFVSIETDSVDYAGRGPLSWQSRHPTSTFIHLIHGANASQMKNVVNSAVAKRAGGIYVTDRKLKEDPWAALASYWNQEVAYVKTK